MLVQQARTVYWKKWEAAKHEYEELEGGSTAGTSSGSAAEENEKKSGLKSIDMLQENWCGRRLGAEKTLRQCLVG